MAAKRVRFAQRRKTVGYSQERLAQRLGIERSTVVRWEAGETKPQPWLRPKLAAALTITVDELHALIDDVVPQTEPGNAQLGRALRRTRLRADVTSEELGQAVHANGETVRAYETSERGPDDPDVVDLLDQPQEALAGYESADGAELVELDAAIAAAMQSFRAADRKVGGGYLYATVVAYLQSAVGPRLLDPAADDGKVLTAASALCEMAGWMAHDAGRSRLADRHFARAFDFSQAGPDPLLSAHVLASRSHLAHHTDLPVDAVHFARRAHEVLRGAPPNPGLRARLLAMEARGHAALNDARTCGKYLAQAETVLAEPRPEVSSPWISGFDEGSLASEAARCMKQLGRHASASRHAEQVIALRSADNHTRSRAFGQLILATVLTESSRPDEACAVAREALEATSSLSSYLVIEQLQELKNLLRPYRTNAVVHEFLTELTSELATRSTIHQWLGASPGLPAVLGGETP